MEIRNHVSGLGTGATVSFGQYYAPISAQQRFFDWDKTRQDPELPPHADRERIRTHWQNLNQICRSLSAQDRQFRSRESADEWSGLVVHNYVAATLIRNAQSRALRDEWDMAKVDLTLAASLMVLPHGPERHALMDAAIAVPVRMRREDAAGWHAAGVLILQTIDEVLKRIEREMTVFTQWREANEQPRAAFTRFHTIYKKIPNGFPLPAIRAAHRQLLLSQRQRSDLRQPAVDAFFQEFFGLYLDEASHLAFRPTHAELLTDVNAIRAMAQRDLPPKTVQGEKGISAALDRITSHLDYENFSAAAQALARIRNQADQHTAFTLCERIDNLVAKLRPLAR